MIDDRWQMKYGIVNGKSEQGLGEIKESGEKTKGYIE